MATDHSNINSFPASRWVELQATGTNVEAITLPTALTPLRISILESLQSDKTTANAFQVSFNQALTDGSAMPAIAEGVDRIQVASGSQLKNITAPSTGGLKAAKMFVSGASSGWVLVAYDVAPGGVAGV